MAMSFLASALGGAALWVFLGLFVAVIDQGAGEHAIRVATETPIYSLKSSGIFNPFVLGLNPKNGKFVLMENDTTLVQIATDTTITYSNDVPPTYVLVRGHNKPSFWLPGYIDVDVSKKLILPSNTIVENWSIE